MTLRCEMQPCNQDALPTMFFCEGHQSWAETIERRAIQAQAEQFTLLGADND